LQTQQKVFVRAADGIERELVLLRIIGETAYVCPESRCQEAIDNPEIGVGFPMTDVKLMDEKKPRR
jgi:hypothetical protein